MFIQKKELLKHLVSGPATHQIVALCKHIEQAEAVCMDLNNKLDNDLAQTWIDIAPDLGYAQEMMSQVIYIFMLIILIGLSFSIINTMLMAVLERKKEIGMMMSVGMNKRQLFSMIAFETIFIALVAAPIGLSIAYFSINYFGQYGIDLSRIAAGLESHGMGSLVFPVLPIRLYLNISLLTLFVSFVSSLLPARRALKMNPSETKDLFKDPSVLK